MTLERISTGIASLDALIEGGIPRGSTVLVAGNPGTGKTILTSHFLYDGLSKGEAGVYVSFSESKKQFYDIFVLIRLINGSNMSAFKISLAIITLTFVLFIGGVQFQNADFVYGQFFEKSGTKSNLKNSSNFSSNSTTSENSNVSGLVLLSQKLNNASFGYRVLEGQIQNKGNDTAKSVLVRLTVYDKDKGVIGSEFTIPHIHTLKPNHKSSFKMTSSIDNFKGMEYYEIPLEWKKPDGSQAYVENAKIYEK